MQRLQPSRRRRSPSVAARRWVEYRLELERARDDVFIVFNEANEGTDTDIRCRTEQPTGTRMQQDVCRSNDCRLSGLRPATSPQFAPVASRRR